jgi:hypothetical protein
VLSEAVRVFDDELVSSVFAVEVPASCRLSDFPLATTFPAGVSGFLTAGNFFGDLRSF